MSEGDKSNRNVVSPCHSHVVWCPKYRRKLLLAPIKERLKQILREGCEEHQAEIEAREVMPDHVQRYGERRSPIWHSSPDEGGQGPFLSSLASGVSLLKWKLPTVWTNSSFCATSGGAPLSLMKQYIEQQKHV